VVRMRAWTGSKWADAKVWTGSQWKSYTPDQYAALVYSYDMNSGANGWVQEYGANGELPIKNWNNIHLYGDDFSSNTYGTAMQLRRGGGIGAMKLRPGDTVHVQASVLVQHISGDIGLGGSLRADLEFGDGLYSTNVSASIQTATGWTGWATLDSRTQGTGYTVPENGGKPYQMDALNVLEVSCSRTAPGALGPFGQFRFFVDWFNVIDQNGTLLYRHTADAVHVVRAWNGSAWV